MVNQEQNVIERAIEEAGKMNISQLREIVNYLASNSTQLDEFKMDPTDYLKTNMEYIPEGFHAHYAEGGVLVPMEIMGEATERFAFSIPIGDVGILSTCVICWDTCCMSPDRPSPTPIK